MQIYIFEIVVVQHDQAVDYRSEQTEQLILLKIALALQTLAKNSFEAIWQILDIEQQFVILPTNLASLLPLQLPHSNQILADLLVAEQFPLPELFCQLGVLNIAGYVSLLQKHLLLRRALFDQH